MKFIFAWRGFQPTHNYHFEDELIALYSIIILSVTTKSSLFFISLETHWQTIVTLVTKKKTIVTLVHKKASNIESMCFWLIQFFFLILFQFLFFLIHMSFSQCKMFQIYKGSIWHWQNIFFNS